MTRRHVMEEGVNGGEPNIASRRAIVALAFQVGQERDYLWRAQILEVQLRDGALSFISDKTQQENQTIAVTAYGVGTQSSQLWKIIPEEIAQGQGQPVRRFRFHRQPPFGQ